MQQAEELLPLKEAARYLGVSRAKLSQLAKEGTLAYRKSPLDKRHKLFRRSDLDALLQQPHYPKKAAER